MADSLHTGLTAASLKTWISDYQQLAAKGDAVSELLSLRFYWRSFSPHLQASTARLAGALE